VGSRFGQMLKAAVYDAFSMIYPKKMTFLLVVLVVYRAIMICYCLIYISCPKCE
jgi:hypothetical protein